MLLYMTTNNKVLRFLREHTLATLATVAHDGMPHAASLYYVVDDDMNLYCVTREETQKYQNIKQQPAVSMVITDEETAETVQLIGHAKKVTDEHAISDVLSRLWKITLDKQHWPAPVVKLSKGGLYVIKITPSELKFGDFKPIHLEGGRDYFDKII